MIWTMIYMAGVLYLAMVYEQAAQDGGALRELYIKSQLNRSYISLIASLMAMCWPITLALGIYARYRKN